MIVPTAASPSAQPAIVKIMRVDALIIIILLLAASTPFAARLLYALAALLLLVDARAAKYTPIAPSSHARRRRRAFATSPRRCRAFATLPRSQRRRRAFAFAGDKKHAIWGETDVAEAAGIAQHVLVLVGGPAGAWQPPSRTCMQHDAGSQLALAVIQSHWDTSFTAACTQPLGPLGAVIYVKQ